MPVDSGGLLADATGRGRPRPRTACRWPRPALGSAPGWCKGARLLVGRRPDDDQLARVAQAHRRRRPARATREADRRAAAVRQRRAAPGPADRRPVPQRGRPGRRPQLRAGCCTTRTPTAPCCPPAPTTGWSASAATASCTAAAATAYGATVGLPANVRAAADGRLALLPGRPPAGAGLGQHRPRGRPGLGETPAEPPPSGCANSPATAARTRSFHQPALRLGNPAHAGLSRSSAHLLLPRYRRSMPPPRPAASPASAATSYAAAPVHAHSSGRPGSRRRRGAGSRPARELCGSARGASPRPGRDAPPLGDPDGGR